MQQENRMRLQNFAPTSTNTNFIDQAFIDDDCLEEMLKKEQEFRIVCPNFYNLQKHITSQMRKDLAVWMMNLCSKQNCQDEVFLLALNFMDAVFTTTPIHKTDLQLIAAACLLIASKLKDAKRRGLSTQILVYYIGDESLTPHDLSHFEMIVLNELEWNLSIVIPLDFLELFLIRLPILSKKCPQLTFDQVKFFAQVLITSAATDQTFLMYSASTMAASSIAVALRGLNWHLHTGRDLRNIVDILAVLIDGQHDFFIDCMVKLEKMLNL